MRVAYTDTFDEMVRSLEQRVKRLERLPIAVTTQTAVLAVRREIDLPDPVPDTEYVVLDTGKRYRLVEGNLREVT